MKVEFTKTHRGYAWTTPLASVGMFFEKGAMMYFIQVRIRLVKVSLLDLPISYTIYESRRKPKFRTLWVISFLWPLFLIITTLKIAGLICLAFIGGVFGILSNVFAAISLLSMLDWKGAMCAIGLRKWAYKSKK